jgi:hypothetical protein
MIRKDHGGNRFVRSQFSHFCGNGKLVKLGECDSTLKKRHLEMGLFIVFKSILVSRLVLY